MKINIYNFLLVILCIISCQNNIQKTQAIAPIIIKNNCDSLIKSALEKVQLNSTHNNDLQVEIIRLSHSLSECQNDNLKCKFELASKPTTVYTGKTTIKNSFNDETKLKNSIMIRDSRIDSLKLVNVALNSKVKDLEKQITKNKNSSSGNNSPNTAKSGNTTKKASWYLWLIVFIAGGFTSQAIRSLITKSI